MNIKKRIPALLLCIVILIAMIPSAIFGDELRVGQPQSVKVPEENDAAVPGLTVKKKWNDGKDHSEDSVTVLLLCDGTATGNVAVLNEANGWKYTFTGLKASKTYNQNPVYYVEETEINGKSIYSLVYDEKKYKEPIVEVTKPKTEVSEDIDQEVRWVILDSNEKISDEGEYVFIAPDTSRFNTNGVPILITFNNDLEIKDTEYVGDSFQDTEGNTYNQYFRGINEDCVWTAEELVDGTDVFLISNSG